MEERDRPFRVVLRGLPSPQNMLSGHLTMDDAEARARKANIDATALGLPADYAAAQKPEVQRDD